MSCIRGAGFESLTFGNFYATTFFNNCKIYFGLNFYLTSPFSVITAKCVVRIMTTHPMSVTQCCLAMNDTHVIRFVYSFASFSSDWMWCLCLDPIVYDCMCVVILVSSVVLRMTFLFLFLNRRLPSQGRSRVEHTHNYGLRPGIFASTYSIFVISLNFLVLPSI